MTQARSRSGRARGSTSRPDNHIIVLFGATGDLARRKLLPGLFHLAAAGLMPDRYQIIGSSRRPMTDEQFRELVGQAVAEFGVSEPTAAAWQAFCHRLSFANADPARTLPLAEAIVRAEQQIGGTPLAASRQTVTLSFREPPLRMFPIDAAGTPNGRRNEITIDCADPGSITASFLA